MGEALIALDDMILAVKEVLGQSLKKMIPLFLILFSLCLGVALGIGYINRNKVSGLSVVAERLGFEDSLHGLADYISVSLDPGMSREQVEQVLLNLGQVEVLAMGSLEQAHEYHPTGNVATYDKVSLEISDRIPVFGQVDGTGFPMYAYYDSQGGLVDLWYAGGPIRTDYPEPDYVDPPELDIFR